MIGRANNYKYSPEKQQRFDEHQANRRQQFEELSGKPFDENQPTNPAWGLLNVVDEMKWNKKDNEKYGPSSDAAFALNAGETTQGPKKKSLKINNQSAVRTGNRKSKLNRSGGSGALRIPTNTINT